MGLYNYVDFFTACPHCGESIDEFQTKEPGSAGEVRFHLVDEDSVKVFLGQCQECKLYIEIDRSHMGEEDGR